MIKPTLRALVAASFFLSMTYPLQAETLDTVNAAHDANAKRAKASQQIVDRDAEKTESLALEYRQKLKLLEGLKVYNIKLDIQIQNQAKQLEGIERSIANVQVIQRQIIPLTSRMIDSLDDFIELDLPFHKPVRDKNLAMLKSNLDRPEISTAEKFRQVLEFYKIEADYGRKIDTYTDTLTVDGVEREVAILQVGRIALLYQTPDMKHTGIWDATKAQYVALDDSYKAAVRQGIRMANKQTTIAILDLPIQAPKAK